MIKKQLYEAPETELLVVRFEGNIMSPAPGGIQNISGDDVQDESDDWA